MGMTEYSDLEFRFLAWLAGWLRRNLARFGVSATVVAVMTITWLLLTLVPVDTVLTLGFSGLALIAGGILGLRLHHPAGSGPMTAGAWLTVIVGVVVLGFVSFSVTLFFALFGSLVGLYVMSALSAVHLVLSFLAAEHRSRASERPS
jgi:hypothetical protein